MGMIIKLMALVADETISDPPYTAPISEEFIAEFMPIDWSIKREQDSTGSWDFSVPISEKYVKELRNYSRAYFYLDGEELMHGLVDDVQISLSGDKVVYNVSGLGEVAELDRVLSAALHYQNTHVVVVLQELLRWCGWRLGDYTTMQNVNERTTIDLRDQETVLQQIQRLCGSIPGLHWRWGGYDCNGKPKLDVGFFDEVQDVYLTQAETASVNPNSDRKNGYITSVTIQHNYTNLVSEIYGRGGTYNLISDPTETGVMNMWWVNQLLTTYPALEDPDFPIVVDPTGAYYRIRNIALYPSGSSIRKTWDYIATQNNEPPSIADLVDGARGLYKKCIRYLQEHATTNESYTVNVTGIHRSVPPSDRIYVDAVTLQYALPDGSLHVVEGESLQGDYRVVSWSASGSNDHITYTYNLTEVEYIGVVEADQDVEVMMDRTLSYNIIPRANGGSSGSATIKGVQDDFTDTAGPADPADCEICEDYSDAISITVAFTVPIAGMDWVKVMGIVSDPPLEFDWEITQEPTMIAGVPNNPAIICFRFRDHPWNLTDEVSMITYFRMWS